MLGTILAENDRALRALRDDLQRILDRVTAPGASEFKPNGGQVTRLVALMNQASADLGATVPGELEEALEVRAAIQGAHQVWEAYRDRLGQRYVPRYQPVLAFADDLARACSGPAPVPRGPDEVAREAALVYFSGETTPMVLPRGHSAVPPLLGDVALQRRYQKLVLELPIPLIALPWRQYADLTGVAAVAHEAGHAVERDHGLKVAEVAERAAPDAADLAKAWAGELFADVWGVACAGPAYVAALAPALAGPVRRLRAERATATSEYPPALARMFGVQHAREKLGFPQVDGGHRNVEVEWNATYDDGKPWPGFAARPIVQRIVDAFIAEPWGPKLTCAEQCGSGTVQEVLDRLKGPAHNGLPGGTDARIALRAFAVLDPDPADAPMLAGRWSTATMRQSRLLVAMGGGFSPDQVTEADRKAGTRLAAALRRDP